MDSIDWDNGKTRRETFKFWDLVRLILENWRYRYELHVCILHNSHVLWNQSLSLWKYVNTLHVLKYSRVLIKNISVDSCFHTCFFIELVHFWPFKYICAQYQIIYFYYSCRVDWQHSMEGHSYQIRKAYTLELEKIANAISLNYARKHIYHVTILLRNICKTLHYTIRMFPPAIDIIPTLLAVVYSNGKYTN